MLLFLSSPQPWDGVYEYSWLAVPPAPLAAPASPAPHSNDYNHDEQQAQQQQQGRGQGHRGWLVDGWTEPAAPGGWVYLDNAVDPDTGLTPAGGQYGSLGCGGMWWHVGTTARGLGGFDDARIAHKDTDLNPAAGESSWVQQTALLGTGTSRGRLGMPGTPSWAQTPASPRQLGRRFVTCHARCSHPPDSTQLAYRRHILTAARPTRSNVCSRPLPRRLPSALCLPCMLCAAARPTVIDMTALSDTAFFSMAFPLYPTTETAQVMARVMRSTDLRDPDPDFDTWYFRHGRFMGL